MPGTRGNLKKTKNPPKVFNRKRVGKTTVAEKTVVAQYVQDLPADLTPRQEIALAHVLGRTPETTRKLIAEAREQLVDRGKRYGEIHLQVAEDALASGDPKALEVARRAAEWGMESISEGTARIVDTGAKAGPGGSKLMIGIKIGGQNDVAVGAKSE